MLPTGHTLRFAALLGRVGWWRLLAPRPLFWVGEFLLFGFELQGRAAAGESLADAVSVFVPPVGVILPCFLEHGFLSRPPAADGRSPFPVRALLVLVVFVGADSIRIARGNQMRRGHGWTPAAVRFGCVVLGVWSVRVHGRFLRDIPCSAEMDCRANTICWPRCCILPISAIFVCKEECKWRWLLHPARLPAQQCFIAPFLR